jgi:hypothetical protein
VVTTGVYKLRNSFHLIGLSLVAICYAIFIRHFESEENIQTIKVLLQCLFIGIELLYASFIYNLAGQALKIAKKDLPLNANFSIKTTQEQCWVHSRYGDTVFRTTLTSDADFNWKLSRSYKT